MWEVITIEEKDGSLMNSTAMKGDDSRDARDEEGQRLCSFEQARDAHGGDIR